VAVSIFEWLQALGNDANAVAKGFQALPMYILVCLAMPVLIGLFVGYGLRFIERTFGVELGKGGH
jgi:hypothetical protein